MYLFDTDTVSHLMRARPSALLTGRLAATPTEQQNTASITIGEIVYGAHRAAERRADLLARLALAMRRFSIVSFDEAAAHRYGEVRAHLERAGTPLAEPDLRIAAIALVHDLTLVTANARHFDRVPELRVENWLG